MPTSILELWKCPAHLFFACLSWCKEHLYSQSWRPPTVPFAFLYSLRCCVHACFEMSFISAWFASVLCLDPIRVGQLQLPVLLQSIQSVIASGKFSINAKMFKAIIPNIFLDTHTKAFWLSGKKCNCWASLGIAFKEWGCFWVSGTRRAVFKVQAEKLLY